MYTDPHMPPRIRVNLYIDLAQKAALALIKEREGIPESVQIRRAIDEWVKQKRVRIDRIEAERRPGGKRDKRS